MDFPPAWFEPPTRRLPVADGSEVVGSLPPTPPIRLAPRRVDASVILAAVVMLLLAAGVVVGLATM